MFHKVGTAVPVAADEGPEFQGPVVSNRRRGLAPAGSAGRKCRRERRDRDPDPGEGSGVSAAAACGVRTVGSGSGWAPQDPLTRPC